MTKNDIKQEFNKPEFIGAVHQERGDFLLPQVVDYITNKKWIDPRPSYQRRQVWTNKEKSKFLESLILNLPVPPLFLYERSYGEWEIMDGQQRSNAIVEFYTGKLKLNGLKKWKELNGLTYKDSPDFVRKSFDRRRIQVTTVLAETKSLSGLDVRKEVFERLNTGGRPLRPQEIRNCLFAGPFCDLLDELSSLPAFTTLWQIPAHKPPKDLKHFSSELLNNKRFARMEDCEMVLRVFALRKTTFFTGAVKAALDNCMKHYYDKSTPEILCGLKDQFAENIDLVLKIFGDGAILVPNSRGKKTPSKQLFDSLMYLMAKHSSSSPEMIKHKKSIRESLACILKDEEKREQIITRHDSKKTFRDRCKNVSDIVDKVLKS